MRLWTLHPSYLAPKGLVAVWREGLLAQKVLMGATKGYRHHPQLARFQAQAEPVPAIAAFLVGVAEEAQRRGYHFDTAKISRRRFAGQIPETKGQLQYEWRHLLAKLRKRAPRLARELQHIQMPLPAHSWTGKPGGENVTARWRRFISRPPGRSWAGGPVSLKNGTAPPRSAGQPRL